MATPAESKLVLNRRHWRVLALALLFAIAPAVRAQDADRDPPARAARVVDVVGDAWLFDHDSREWTRLTRNQTVGEGDRVRTDDRARISLRVGSTTVWVDERDITLAPDTSGGMLKRTWRAIRTVLAGERAQTESVTTRRVERRRWSPSELAQVLPGGHAVLSLTAVDGTPVPPLLVDLRS